MTSGYTYCVCRDCFDVTVSSDVTKPELCAECLESGCASFSGATAFPSSDVWECQRDDAYTFDETEH